MKNVICLISVIVMMAFSFPYACAESASLSWKEANALMDAFESLDFDEAWEWKEYQKENTCRTREWEAEYGPLGRWQGDTLAAYALAYGVMPTHDAPYAEPLAALPGTDNLPEIVARTIAMDAVEKVVDRLPRAVLENMESTWGFY